jgi:GTP1/Obg family GTP-binding protein
MNLDNDQLKELKSLFELGISVESISIVVAFCLKHDRQETLHKFRKLLEEFNSSLSAADKQELENDLKMFIDAKMADVARELKTSLTQEEINDFLKELKQIEPNSATLFQK